MTTRRTRLGLLALLVLLVLVVALTLGTSTAVAEEPYNVTESDHERFFNTSDQEINPNSVAWDDDGTSLYVAGSSQETVFEYAISDAYNVSTASLSHSTDISSNVGAVTGMVWNNDGTKLYFTDANSGEVHEYDATTPYDSSSISFSQSFDASSQEFSMEGLAWNDDGSKLYLVGRDNDNVYEYDLTTDFDISTASFSQSVDVSGQASVPEGVAWNNDGTKMYVADDSSQTIYEYEATSAYDVSTVSFERSKDVSSDVANPSGLAWKPDGTKYYVTDDNALTNEVGVHQYTIDPVSGTVVNNQTDDGIQGVTVGLYDAGGSLVSETSTDSNGEWSVDVSDGSYQVAFTVEFFYGNVTNVTVSGDTDVGTTRLDPIPTAYFNADPRAGEFVQNRSTSAFNISIETREPDGQDSQVTSRFMWFNETSGEWEEFNSIDWNTDGGTRVTHDFESPHDWNPGSNRWFVNTTTDRGDFHSSNYTFISPGNMTLVNASDTSQVISTDTFDITLTSLDSNFEDTRQTTDGLQDLNDIPQEDYRVDIVQAGGPNDWRDRILIIDDTDISALWTVAIVNNTVFQNQAPWYTQEFELDDQTGEWQPRETYLLLEQRVDGEFEIITGGLFGFQNSVELDVNDTEDYRMTLLHAVRGDTRTIGTFEANRSKSDEVETITVIGSVGDPTDDDAEGYFVDAFIDGNHDPDIQPYFQFQWNDPDELTTDLEFTVYERGNEDNILRNLSNVSFDQLGKTTFTQTINNTEANMTWVVDWDAKRNGTAISGRIIVGGDRFDPNTDMPDIWKHWGATIFIILVGGLFGGSVNARLGVIITPMFAGIFWVSGWLPTTYTSGIIIFALLIGGMLLVANHRLGD